MAEKIPEEFTYEYMVMLDHEELASYFSDAVPPEIGTLVDPWEFVVDEAKQAKKLQYQGPFRVVDVVQQPKNMDIHDEVSSQTFVQILVEKAKGSNMESL
jgi:hypothetical protein